MKLITVSGPRGAGKEEIVKRLLTAFPRMMHRVVPHTTRKPRPGEQDGREYHFVSEEQFEGLVALGEFVYTVRMKEQRSGTVRAELLERPVAVIDITDEGARRMRELVTKREGGSVFTVFVYASPEERRRRLAKREPSLSPEEVRRLLEDDPVNPDPFAHTDFKLVLANPDGRLDVVADRIIAAVSKFLGSAVRVAS